MNRTQLPPHSATSAVLAGRLRTGEQMVEAAADSEERAQLAAFWLNLLHQYEAAVDAERDQEVQVPA